MTATSTMIEIPDALRRLQRVFAAAAAEVDAIRGRNALPPVAAADILHAEMTSTGADYAQKFALRCARLAVSADLPAGGTQSRGAGVLRRWRARA